MKVPDQWRFDELIFLTRDGSAPMVQLQHTTLQPVYTRLQRKTHYGRGGCNDLTAWALFKQTTSSTPDLSITTRSWVLIQDLIRRANCIAKTPFSISI